MKDNGGTISFSRRTDARAHSKEYLCCRADLPQAAIIPATSADPFLSVLCSSRNTEKYQATYRSPP